MEVIDRFHHNGDSFWDGDQTLYDLDIADGTDRGQLLVVVPRGNAFISPEAVARRVEGLGASLDALRATARRPAPDRRPQLDLWIEPGQN